MNAPPPRVLVVSTMYPNEASPDFGIFVHRRLLHASRYARLSILSPIPYFPLGMLLDRYAHRAKIPSEGSIDGLPVRYPRYFSIPRYLKPLDGIFLSLVILREALRSPESFDLIDAHLAYPDGFAAVIAGAILRKPVTITLRGHDVNDLPRHPVRGRQIRWTLRSADRVMAVADALRRRAVELGSPEERTETIPNGVDPTLFSPIDKSAARRRLGLPLEKRIVLSVGYLVERKGVHLVVEAVGMLRDEGVKDLLYVVVGGPGEEGDYRSSIEETIRRRGLEESVVLAGPKPNRELKEWYGAADLLCLASSKEGWANVLLESLAVGTPVVATAVWGTPEVISSPDYGTLVERTPRSIADGIREALRREWKPEELVRYARGFSWDEVGRRVVRNYRLALRRGEE